MKVDEFRAEIIKQVTRFVRKWKPLSIQCPLTVEVKEVRHAGYRHKKCETCRWKSNIYHGNFTDGNKQFYCRRAHYDSRVGANSPACPWYED